MDAGKWLTEQKARLAAADMIKRVAASGPRIAFFDPPLHPGALGFDVGSHIHCRCVIKPPRH